MLVAEVEPLDERCEDGGWDVGDGEGFPLAWWRCLEGVEEVGEVGGGGEEEVGVDVEEGVGGGGGRGGGGSVGGWSGI